MSSLVTIDGNIKQQLLPFVLDPSNPINQYPYTDNTGTPQFFSFDPTKFSNHPKAGLLGIAPCRFKKYMSKDIANKLLYNREGREITNGKIKLKTIYEHLPRIEIREYLPASALDQILNFFRDLVGLTENSKSTTEVQKTDDASWIKKAWAAVQDLMAYIMGDAEPNMFGVIQKSLKNISFSDWKENGFTRAYVATFPLFMYYHILSSTTTNVYEIPFIVNSDRLLYNSDGSAGWGAGEFGIESIPVVGKILSNIPGFGSLLKSIKINYQRAWDGSGSMPVPPLIDVEFDLFNDNVDQAISNFIFVNTIIPNNRPMQYHMINHSPDVYDIKIGGFNRYYMCSAKFQVTQNGILRNPSDLFLKKLEKHVNTSAISLKSSDFINNLYNNDCIKIPDIYHVKLSFNSLFPESFNQFLFDYGNNTNIIQNVQVYQGNAVADVIGSIIKGGATVVKNAFTSGQSKVYDQWQANRDARKAKG